MRQNPFVTSDAALGKDFFGREKEINEIKRFLDKKKESNLLIYGQRRIGKTSLLRKIQEKVKNSKFGKAVFFDLQNKARYEISMLLFDLAVQICVDVEANISFSKDDFIEAGFKSYFKDVFLPKVFETLPEDRQLVLLFDEFDTLGELEGVGGDPKVTDIAYHKFIPYIEAMKERNNFPLKFIFAVGRNYKDLDENRYGQITKTGRKIELTYFAKEELEDLLKLSDDVLPFEKDAVNRLYEFTSAHPFFSQCLASSAFEAADDLGQRTISREIVERQFIPALNSYGGGVRWFWDSFPANDKVILYLMALIKQDEKQISEKNIRSEAVRLSLGPAIHKLDDILEKSINNNVIKKAASKQVHYEFYVEFFRKWILMEFTLEEIGSLLKKIDPQLDFYLNNANYHYKIGNLSEAKKFFENIIAKYPSHYHSLYHLGLIYKNLIAVDKSNIYKASDYWQQAYLQNPFGTKDEYLFILKKKLSLVNEKGKGEDEEAEKVLEEIHRVEPADIKFTEKLVELYIAKNRNIAGIENLSKVEELDFNKKGLIDLPVEIELLRNLRKLDLRNNRIQQLPVQITELKNLDELLLVGNPLKIPENIIKGPVKKILEYVKTTSLIKKDMEIVKELEKEIGRRLLQVEIEDLREETDNCFALNEKGWVVGLNLDGVQKIFISPFIKELKNLEILSLINTELSDCNFLSELIRLTQLNLAVNQLTDISALSGLSQLRELILNDNQLTDISALSGLSQLAELKLYNNRLTDISVLSNLSQLSQLNLSGNKQTDISVLSNLSQLTELYLSFNKLTDISALSNLSQLRELRLNNNQLPDISALSNLSRLTFLNVVNNKIKELPETIVNMGLDIDVEKKNPYSSDKNGIFLYGNLVETPPIEILKKGREAALAYFRALVEETRPVNEIKALLVGDGGAGKTSLVKCLMGKEFDKKEYQTHGLNIDDWEFVFHENDAQEKINVHLWDFGGQEIMHSTHQFFLSKRSLYILVLDGRRDEKTEYWLKHIESFGGDSPVLVVINKIDQNPGFDVNRKFLLEKYSNIKGFFRLSCATKEGIDVFCRTLQEELARVEMMQTTWPASWFNVKTHLENMKKHYISYKEYEEICSEAGIAEESSRDVLVDFLHDLGVALHFRELALEDTHVLEPEWATGAVYKIINSSQLAESKGILTTTQLPQILKKNKGENFDYPKDKYPYIIQLMRKFEICYKMNKNRVLFPDLLPVEEVEFDFDYENALRFVLEYDFLPRSVMPRFIVKMHEDIENRLRWRTGVVLKNEIFHSRALIKSDDMDETIFIYVSGNQKRDFFSVIRHAFQIINQSFEKLKVNELVPLPDNEQELVKYKDLIGLEQARRDEIFIGSLGRSYSVVELLNGIIKPENRGLDQKLYFRDVKGDVHIHYGDNIQVNIQQIKNIYLPAVQDDFDSFKKMLAKADPALKEELKEIGDALDELGPGSDKKEFNKPLNKLGRFIKDLADQDTPLGKTVAGIEKAVDLGQKVGRTYNKIAQWLALPQVPDVLVGSKK
ncbi:MAG: leucine-rich repeat domain-containing protein [Candidatus Aminicenantes bacterium]|nr:leucine-rich repeat domain-containing protein [Candidatus Aminicenantes bacterium]